MPLVGTGREKLRKRIHEIIINPEINFANTEKSSNQEITITSDKQPKIMDALQSPTKSVSTQYEPQKLEQQMEISQERSIKIGQIKRQNLVLSPGKLELKKTNRKIKDIDEKLVMEFCSNEKKLS